MLEMTAFNGLHLALVLLVGGGLFALLHRTWPHRQRQPLRIGELNTGEFVLVDDTGHAQVIGIEASDVLRELARRPTSGETVFSQAIPAEAGTSRLSDL